MKKYLNGELVDMPDEERVQIEAEWQKPAEKEDDVKDARLAFLGEERVREIAAAVDALPEPHKSAALQSLPLVDLMFILRK